MTALRILSACAWGLLAVYMAKGAWAAARAKYTRHGDPMRLACFMTALLMIGFAVLGLVRPGDSLARAALYVLAVADAAFIWRLGRAYGRGPLV
ncbi:MAG: hypothetical protein ACOYBT_09890 [Polynucleobacter sp.]